MTVQHKPPELRDPRRVASGRASIRRRWDADAIAHGRLPGRRVVRLDSLDAMSRQIVVALVEAAEHAAAAKAAGAAAAAAAAAAGTE